MSKVFYPTEEDYQDLEDEIVKEVEEKNIEEALYPDLVDQIKDLVYGGYPIRWYPDHVTSDGIFYTSSGTNPCATCPNFGKGPCLCTLPSVHNPHL